MKRGSRTPWKKSRTYGDIYGGRSRVRMSDNIFARTHSLHRPSADQALPILLQDSASRDYIFPVTADELAQTLKNLPESDGRGITHIWLRRTPIRARKMGAPLAEFVCGSGVRLIVIYPWRKDGRMCIGHDKPQAQAMAPYLRFGASVICEDGRWYVEFSEANLKRFYIEHLFCHELGHHVDWYNRNWSKANSRQTEEFADQYAVQWGANAAVLQSEV